MLVVFANNQVVVGNNAVGVVVTTDPVAIGDNNRATGITDIHANFNVAGGGLAWIMQVSNDGQTWVNQGPALATTTSTGESLQIPVTISGVYARLMITFTSTTALIGAAIFDIHVNFDRT